MAISCAPVNYLNRCAQVSCKGAEARKFRVCSPLKSTLPIRCPSRIRCAESVVETEKIILESFGWKVRDAKRDDLRAVALIQAEVFFEPTAFGALDAIFFEFFKAEVYDSILQKAKYAASNRYTCLLAKSSRNDDENESTSPVGVVDLTVLWEDEVLKLLDNVSKYLYVSGMAVKSTNRNSKVATALLEAVEKRALDWSFEYLVLHVHEDNIAARRLYQKAGYRAIDVDPLWQTKLLGRKRRVLMAKRTNGFLDNELIKRKSSEVKDID